MLGLMTTSNAMEIKMVIGKAVRSGFQMLLVICGHVPWCGEKMKPGDGGVQRAQGESGGGPAFGNKRNEENRNRLGVVVVKASQMLSLFLILKS